MLTQQQMYDLMYEVRGAVMEVYNHFGPGLLESAYEKDFASGANRRIKE